MSSLYFVEPPKTKLGRFLRRVYWYLFIHKWWRDLVPWWVLDLVDKHFNVCWANMVSWKMLDGAEDGVGPKPICGASSVWDEETKSWKEGFDGRCYCGHYYLESELLRDCARPAWAPRIKPTVIEEEAAGGGGGVMSSNHEHPEAYPIGCMWAVIIGLLLVLAAVVTGVAMLLSGCVPAPAPRVQVVATVTPRRVPEIHPAPTFTSYPYMSVTTHYMNPVALTTWEYEELARAMRHRQAIEELGRRGR